MATLHPRFLIGKFLFQVAAQFALLLFAFRMLFPTLWATQIQAGFWLFVLVFTGMQLLNCFFEWWFHRYVLHMTIFRWLRYLHQQHTLHHDLTNIRLVQKGRCVLNEYPIDKEEQYEASAFPLYALAAFWLLFLPLLVAVQWVLPDWPILLGGVSAITFSMIGYEVLHAIEHYPYAWWEHAVQKSRFRKYWKKIYAFHHFHHANRQANESISGFFGLPVADWILGTYTMPKDLLLSGRVASIADFTAKKPYRLVCWLDTWARKRQAKLRSTVT